MTGAKKVGIYLEVGRRRTFAGAVEWPGWCRSGKDEGEAIAALFGAGARYSRVARFARLAFTAPASIADLSTIERVKGNATTEFGAPDRPLGGDEAPVPQAEARRLVAILHACWRTFDHAARAAQGRTLRKGPRGGGRELDAIVRHVLESEAGYLGRLNRRHAVGGKDPATETRAVRRAVVEALSEVAATGTPPPGPRGGERWSARRFTRRVAWHVLDHAWEIEDRLA